MVVPALPPYRRLELAGLFAIVLVVSVVLITIANNHQHDRLAADARASCLKDEQIAANQRRVILALIELEHRETEHEGLKADGKELRLALARVPEFNCK